MAIRIAHYTLFMRKEDVEKHYFCGLAGFRRQYPHCIEDEHLIAVCSMSGGEMQEYTLEICERGLIDMALAEWELGWLMKTGWAEIGISQGTQMCWLKEHAPEGAAEWRGIFGDLFIDVCCAQNSDLKRENDHASD